MNDGDGAGLTGLLSGAVGRITALTDLLANLDQRIITTLDSVDDMRTTMAGFEAVGDSSDRLIADLQVRIEQMHERLDRDMDEIKAVLLAKLGDLDLSGLGPRFDRLEQAIFNIERATVNLEIAMEGGLDAMPEFVSKRIKSEMGKRAIAPGLDESRSP